MSSTRQKKTIVGVMIVVAIAAIVIFAGCIEEKAPASTPIPPTTPVSQGYIQSYDHNINYGFEYPEDWEIYSPDEFSLTQGVKKVDIFTKSSEATSIIIIAKTTNWKNLDEVKNLYKEIYREIIVKKNIIEVNNVKGYEMTRLNSPTKFKVVIFIVNDMVYEFNYGATEDLYDGSEGIFDHVINSFVIK